MELSEGVKERLGVVVDAVQTGFHWGFVPLVLYLGFMKGAEPGMPPLNVFSLLWQ
ncbi:mitochondrial import receptor subunit TOM7 homolog [Drosophila gunungcola]|uniref:Mitochondrial import receptor subunit TOM7 homolog n=1 Tax=Drosophila rhopaloa TaxID=1041015 RepID=A0A6P4FIG1_DRORH|nr:mitochondrial import receptor subunit TOM7 homolog [Drosophila rhopaloa]XP_017133130.1 mitochondrial import receptor subunit TOM7 homolog [Drosophila elegans]XP_052843369.1 mitochondrial import receptor subunit TOM7 homolog [Drosophila gunungcola]